MVKALWYLMAGRAVTFGELTTEGTENTGGGGYFFVRRLRRLTQIGKRGRGKDGEGEEILPTDCTDLHRWDKRGRWEDGKMGRWEEEKRRRGEVGGWCFLRLGAGIPLGGFPIELGMTGKKGLHNEPCSFPCCAWEPKRVLSIYGVSQTDHEYGVPYAFPRRAWERGGRA